MANKMKCIRCGKEHPNNVEVCDVCHFNFKEYRNRTKYYGINLRPEEINDDKRDLIIRPLLSFMFGIFGLMIPAIAVGTGLFFIIIFALVLNILAIRIAKRPAQSTFEYVRKFGIGLGILGLIISSIIFLLVLYFTIASILS